MAKKTHGLPTTEKNLIRELSKNHDAQEGLMRKLGELQDQEKKVKEELQKLWSGKKSGGGHGDAAASPSAEK